MGDPQKAIQDLTPTTKLRNDNRAAFLKLSLLHYSLGEHRDSLKWVGQTDGGSWVRKLLTLYSSLVCFLFFFFLQPHPRVSEAGPGRQRVFQPLQAGEEAQQAAGFGGGVDSEGEVGDSVAHTDLANECLELNKPKLELQLIIMLIIDYSADYCRA